MQKKTSIRSRSYRHADREEAVRLLEKENGTELIVRLPADENEEKRSGCHARWVIEENGSLSGIALVHTRTFHPNSLYLDMRVVSAALSDHVEKALMQTVLDAAGDRPIQVSFRESDRLSASFYASFGFGEMRRTYMPQLFLRLSDEKLCGSEHAAQAEILTFAELAVRDQEADRLAELMRDCYIETHAANPPGDHPLSVWKRFAEADDVLPEGSFAAVEANADGRQVTAFAVLHGEQGSEEAELGWLGAREGREALMHEVERRRMAYCRSAGFSRLSAEIDTTDHYQFPLLKRYGLDCPPPLLTYRREGKRGPL